MTPENRSSAPKAELSDVTGASPTIDIDALAISNSWKQKFHLFQKAGGPKQPNLKALSSGEKFKISFNILAFLFGPIYYLTKGMWKKALSLFAASFAVIVLLSLALELFGLDRIANALGFGAAAFFAVRANIDYYKKMVLGDKGWW